MESSETFDPKEDVLMSLKSLDLVPRNKDSNSAELMNQLIEYLNDLVIADFNKLVSVLYRIDIEETKLRTALETAAHTESAGETIAQLIVERQRQKIILRRRYQKRTKNDQ